MANLQNTDINDDGFLQLPVGPSSARPQTGLEAGMFRYNTTTGNFEVYDGTEWAPIAGESLFGSGAAGDITTSGTINDYAYMTTSSVSTSDSVADFNTVSGFNTGDRVLIHQTQDGTATSQPGNFEEKQIAGISGTTVTFTEPFTKGYNANSGANTNTSRQVQMVSIPQYNNLTLNGNITAKDWDGRSGGIIAFKCKGTLNCNGFTVTVAESGYRGGAYGPGNNDGGFSGEGRYGYDTTRHSGSINQNDYTAGGGGEAGPAASLGGCGAGGGSHATAGGVGTRNNGTTIAYAGATYGAANLENELHFGGAGGGGGDNDNQGGSPVTAGEGGGIILVWASGIQSGRFNANGRTHVQDPVQGSCGPAVNGSGAGGSIWLKSNSANITSCTANGGARVQNNGDCNGDGQNHPNGGAGGNGRVRFDGSFSGSSSPAAFTGDIDAGIDF